MKVRKNPQGEKKLLPGWGGDPPHLKGERKVARASEIARKPLNEVWNSGIFPLRLQKGPMEVIRRDREEI